MERLTRIILYLGLALLLLFLASCEDGTGIEVPTEEEPAFAVETVTYTVLEYEEGVMADLQPATLEKGMGWSDSLGDRAHDRNGMWHRRHNRRAHALHEVLTQLELTEDVTNSVKTLTDAHFEFITEARERLMAEVGDIIEAANEERRLIHEQVKNEELTREEAKVQIQALNEATRDLIDQNPVAVEIKEELCAAKVQLFSDIGLLLNADQLVIWEDWIGTLEGPCFTD